MLSQKSRFCSHLCYKREINDEKCLWHSSTCLQIMYKILLPWTRQKPASCKQLLRREASMASHQHLAQQDPRRFSQYHFPWAYSQYNLCLALPSSSQVCRSSWAACTEALSRQWMLHLEASLKGSSAGHSIKLIESPSDNFREKLKKYLSAVWKHKKEKIIEHPHLH